MRASKPVILVCGFYGRGNSGDEALLQCAYEAFADSFDVWISLDQFGAYPKFWDWYPYNQTKIIHTNNIAIFSNRNLDIRGVLVGGGGLPLGFAANQLIQAKMHNVRTAAVGLEFSLSNEHSEVYKTMAKKYFELFDYFSVRNRTAYRNGKSMGLDLNFSGDLALRLQEDQDQSIDNDSERVLIVLREFQDDLMDISNYRSEIQKIAFLFEKNGKYVEFLPFSPEDERFCQKLGYENVLRHWWNPRKIKQIISSSYLTISVGRLHPLIFAAGTNAKICYLNPPLRGLNTDPVYKAALMCLDLGIDYFKTADELINKVDNIKSVNRQNLEDLNKLLAKSINNIKGIFA